MDRKTQIEIMLDAQQRAKKSAAKVLGSPKLKAALKASHERARQARRSRDSEQPGKVKRA